MSCHRTPQKPEVPHENTKIPRVGQWPSSKSYFTVVMSMGSKPDRRIRISALPLTSCMILGRLMNFAEP